MYEVTYMQVNKYYNEINRTSQLETHVISYVFEHPVCVCLLIIEILPVTLIDTKEIYILVLVEKA